MDPDQPPPAPRRRRLLPAVALVLVAALAVLSGMAAAGGAVPTLGRTVDGTALPAPTTTTTAATRTTPTPSATTTPPPKPVYLLADHPLLAAGVSLPDAICQLPRFRRDTESLRAYYQAFVTCMDAAWRPVLLARGMPHTVPKINVAERPGRTGCGNPDEDDDVGQFTAMYCPADETLYLPVDRLKAVDRGLSGSHLAVVAHEYAHHVQELSGLLWAAAEEIDNVPDGSAQANELTRRTELQANCFAGLFLAAAAGRGSISRGLADQAVAEFRNGALPDTHGSKANQASWARQGYRQRTTAACNTWSAPANSVG